MFETTEKKHSRELLHFFKKHSRHLARQGQMAKIRAKDCKDKRRGVVLYDVAVNLFGQAGDLNKRIKTAERETRRD